MKYKNKRVNPKSEQQALSLAIEMMTDLVRDKFLNHANCNLHILLCKLLLKYAMLQTCIENERGSSVTPPGKLKKYI